MRDIPRAHDLLWGMSPAQLPADAPAWVRLVLEAGEPVVVRRAMVASGLIPVGIRGASRDQRYATLMSAGSVRRRVRPEELIEGVYTGDLPALHALIRLRPVMEELSLDWGVTGSVGYQLATGIATAHANSDLDLLVRAPQLIARSRARALLQRVDDGVCRVDIQLETPAGAIALREWAGDTTRVLLKCPTGARLIENPWNQQEQAA